MINEDERKKLLQDAIDNRKEEIRLYDKITYAIAMAGITLVLLIGQFYLTNSNIVAKDALFKYSWVLLCFLVFAGICFGGTLIAQFSAHLCSIKLNESIIDVCDYRNDLGVVDKWNTRTKRVNQTTTILLIVSIFVLFGVIITLVCMINK